MARVHLGAGVSTGIGPVGFYTSLGGAARRGRSGTAGVASARRYQQQYAAQQALAGRGMGLQEFHAVVAAFQRILHLHRVDFPAAQPPVAPPPQPPDPDAIYKHYRRQALTGIGTFDRAERARAKQRAVAWAQAEVERQLDVARTVQAHLQEQLNERWQHLCANHPTVVIETLDEAFEDNEAPAAAVGVAGDEVSLVVVVPDRDDVIPVGWPVHTAPSGLTSVRHLSAGERAALYTLFVCGQLLVTIRETFAVAPTVATARVAVLRKDRIDAYGRPRVSCLIAATFDRSALDGVRWDTVDAAVIVNDVSTECMLRLDRAGELTPIDLADEPELRALVEAADLTELISDH